MVKIKKIVQFGFKFIDPMKLKGVPVLDCRVIKNPYSKFLSEDAQKEIVRNNPLFNEVVAVGVQLLSEHDKIFVGCLFGKHRSGAVSEEIAKRTGAVIQHFGK